MEPNIYSGMTNFMRPLPQQAPVDEQPAEQAEASTSQQLNQPSLTDWTVHGPDVVTLGRPSRPWMSTTQQQPFIWNGESGSKGDRNDEPMSLESEATPRASDHTSHYPHPELSLPHPALSLDFRMSVLLNPKISIGTTPFGYRNWISFTGGSWSGSWGSGIVLPGGQDSQLIIENGAAHLDTNYILQTLDNPPAHIVIRTHGWRTGPPEILAQLANPEKAESMDPNSYKFRIFIEMETGDERYKNEVNCGMWVGAGMRKGAEVIYDAYRLS